MPARVAAEQGGPLGWYDVSTLKEPYRIEGKKTMAYEIAEQMDWTYPDWIIYPTGGGTGMVGMWKAFDELERIGWVQPQRRPRMVSVQAEGCAPIVRAFTDGTETGRDCGRARATVADGLRVPRAIGDFLILRAVRESGGTALAVSDAGDGRRHAGDRRERRHQRRARKRRDVGRAAMLVERGDDQAARLRGAAQHRRRAEVPRRAAVLNRSGRPPPSQRAPLEGTTLVVDVTNQNAKGRLDMVGNFSSDHVHVVERFAFADANTLNYRATIEDPTVYTRPWTIASKFVRGKRGQGEEYWEDACHEGERSADAMVIRTDAGANPAK